MDVFISWSGSRSHAVAESLRHFLPNVLPGVRPWMSDEDIGAGVVWTQAIGSKLDSTHFGIICATASAIDSKWVTFEAGALSKRVGTARVVPYLIGMAASDVDGPLSMFQTVRADRKGTLDLVKTLEQASSERIDSGNVGDRFDAFWPKLQAVFDSLSDLDEPAPRRPEREMLGEILTVVRMLGRMFELTSSLTELTSFEAFDDLDEGYDPEERSRRQRAQLRVMRFLMGATMRFLQGSADMPASSDDELVGGFSHLATELRWAKDREALLAAHIIVAQKGGADPTAITRVLGQLAPPKEVADALALARVLMPQQPLSGGTQDPVASSATANTPLKRTGRKGPAAERQR